MVFNFFKKLFGNNDNESEIKEKIYFDDLGNWVENKTKEIENKEKEIFVLIKDKTSLFIQEINEKIKILETVDIESKKIEDRVKLIVEENLNYYINHLKKFIENLEYLDEKNLGEFKDKIDDVFLDFHKKSDKNYQKATFLIGKEIGAIQDSMTNFSGYLIKLFKDNKDIINISKVISSTRLNLKQISDIDENINGINKKMKVLDKNVNNIKEMDKKVLGEIEEIKKSKNYIENLKKKEEIRLSERELENKIYKLREIIDFKVLGNIFHVDEGKINIIKSYKENFLESFQKDGGASILGLLNEAKLNNEEVYSKIKQINDKKEEIIGTKKTIEKDETKELLSKIVKVRLDIENLNNEKARELKMSEKFKVSRENMINFIKNELIEINVII
ncbi:hypothetical protein K8R47_01710 [archaeon]|nr:hypothetical protein [archaeon]